MAARRHSSGYAPILAFPDARRRSRKRTFVNDRKFLPANFTTTKCPPFAQRRTYAAENQFP